MGKLRHQIGEWKNSEISNNQWRQDHFLAAVTEGGGRAPGPLGVGGHPCRVGGHSWTLKSGGPDLGKLESPETEPPAEALLLGQREPPCWPLSTPRPRSCSRGFSSYVEGPGAGDCEQRSLAHWAGRRTSLRPGFLILGEPGFFACQLQC